MNKARENFLYAGSIIGYREWKINCIEDNGIYTFKLGGIGTGDNGNSWNTGINIAKCLKDKSKHKSPDFDCDCGFWGYNSKINMIVSMAKSDNGFNSYPGSYMYAGFSPSAYTQQQDTYYIGGEVQFTGTVIEHEEGYRAEKAEIKKLLWIYKDKDLLFKFERKLTDKERLELEQIPKDLLNAIQQVSYNRGLPAYQQSQQSYNQQLSAWQYFVSQMVTSQPSLPSQQQAVPSRLGYEGYSKQMLHKSFKKEEVIKALQDYYKVPIIYWKDYFREEK